MPRPLRRVRKVLIANRGEIARRVIRAANSLGIDTVAVFSDADAGALYVQEADEAVRLPGTAAADTYLAVDRIVEAARRTGADAIHPGYGFLSENAAFAGACEAAGLTFVGPPAGAIGQMGDKLEAKAIMANSGVPVLPSVTVAEGADIDPEAVLAEVGLPAIIKASAGGGGRGMRIVTDPADFAESLHSARREAESAFGDPTVFVERYISPARHIEVQVVADAHGGAAALFERECSIQRRHQKVVEESPSPYVGVAMRAELIDAAIKAVRAVDYLGVGTVEFVAGDGIFAFLEMNTRLQVEHPVTEAITGVDLVRLQFEIAAGSPLPPEVTAPTMSGHAIEVRLCAEDPAAGYLPASGRFALFEIGDTGLSVGTGLAVDSRLRVGAGVPALRVDSGIATGSDVPPYYDSMVAKVIAHAPTRLEAASKLARALERARLHGVVTNRDLLVNVLRSPEFLAGDTTTDFLDRVPGMAEPRTDAAGHRANAVAAAIAADAWARRQRPVQPAIPSGWRNNRTALGRCELRSGDLTLVVEHDLSGQPSSVGKFSQARLGELANRPNPTVHVGGAPVDVELYGVTAAGPAGGSHADADPGADFTVDMAVNGVRRRYRATVANGEILVDGPVGASSFERVPLFSDPEDVAPEGGLTAPMPGKVVRVLVVAGQAVTAGEAVVVLEAMKMEHTIASPVTGEVTAVHVKEGEQVERGAVLAAVEER